jgi:hypothetical protein
MTELVVQKALFPLSHPKEGIQSTSLWPFSRLLLRARKREKKKQKHTTGGIPRWSPTLVLVARFSAYVWQSGRDAQFSLTCGRMCSSFKIKSLYYSKKDHVTLILGTQPIRKPIHRKNLRETLRLPSQGI